ncbi:hypothetical protein RhiirA5_436933 [Rhizophagus irregularis]|uniref:Uncharacterized protein n=1 Tax=Rhizophagus irregularis TaxID=588596 RepID=A0A2N0NL57_9GLOM|nr:hypothetical protein RhiirA5_436933 [Rhizophagus irregularis]
MVDKLLPKLSQNLLEMLNDDDYYDVTFEVGNDSHAKIFRVSYVIVPLLSQRNLSKAIVTSLGAGLQDAWIIPQKKKNFNTFISSGIGNSSLVNDKDDNEKKEKNMSALKYTKKEVVEMVAKAIEDRVKEKELFKENVSKTAREIAEIQKANAERSVREKDSKSSKVTPSVDEEEVVALVNKKENVTGEVPVSKEEVELYNKVIQACSSCLPPEIKREEISVDEKIGHKRCNKEELSREAVSSDGTDEESESENVYNSGEKKKSAQGGKVKKVEN